MSNSTLTPPRIPKPYFTKTDTLATYGVGFGCSIYDWNHNFIDLPMALFQWRWSHLKIPSESTGIVDTSGHLESVRVLCHRLLGRWPVYHVKAH
jgi:hypothetical protein